MAMIRCTECGNQISSEAKTCPYCGKMTKSKELEDKATGTVIGWLIAGLMFLIMLIVGIVMLSNLSYWDRASHSSNEFMGWFFLISGLIGGLVCNIEYLVKINKLKKEKQQYVDSISEKMLFNPRSNSNRIIENPVLGKTFAGKARDSSFGSGSHDDQTTIQEPETVSDISRYCWKCGKRLDYNSGFCEYCGSKL